jgi:hypothetical protein
VSFDIFVQAFEGGEAARRGGGAVRDLLLAAADRHEPAANFAHVLHGDGEADVYGVPDEGADLDGLTFNHVAGDAFDLIVDVARVADLVVMPVGCPVCVVDAAQRRHLPRELAHGDVEVVRSGAALRRVIERA